MSGMSFADLDAVAAHLRRELEDNKRYILLYAYNGTGKTRLSMAFKNAGKQGEKRDTLYFNAYTEDLFTWDNDSERTLEFNAASPFFAGLQELEMETRIRPFLHRYVDFEFAIDYEKGAVRFSREVPTRTGTETVENIKVSRGEENIFIWCFFLAVVQLAIDGAEAYKWVKYLYIDDPISSLDDNNAIAVACHLADLLRQTTEIKAVISSHHGLFFNVVCNELRKRKHKKYFLHKSAATEQYVLRATDATPFFHHVALLSELHKAAKDGPLYTCHFNMLRSIMEKTATFFGHDDFSYCLQGMDDEVLYARALNLLSHGNYSLYEPREMVEDTKRLFQKIFQAFMDRYQFKIPELALEETRQESNKDE